ncbi:hypothetical protein [Pseudomonas sp. FW300-N2A2]|uniref:hypothetical protein n=1 Tax=Pseudomonas sp. FW300-N2A2 TaxID=2751316 RepID=UPI001A924C49|nr:hypothetical protein [Pseudomonas sp. FW300-N2A2]
MDETIARIKTSREAKIFASNAKRLGDLDAEAKALDRALDLQAKEEGYETPAEIAIARALYIYEDLQGTVAGKAYRANRTRKMIREHGALLAAERMVIAQRPSRGYTELAQAGLGAHSFEAIINQYPEEFSNQAVMAAQARLTGVKHESVVSNKDVSFREFYSPIPIPDAEALLLIERFKKPENRFQSIWKPHYTETINKIRLGLESGRVADVMDLVWSERDNGVSNAAQGVLGMAKIDSLRAQFEALTAEISVDGSPETFQTIVRRLAEWRDEGLITKLPMLLIARAFAAIHPERYHTLVVEEKHEQVLPWFCAHTGFSVPSGNWAQKAQALMAHMDSIDAFEGENVFRSMFPWFVFEHLRTADQRIPFIPGHTERSPDTVVDLPATSRQVLLRHNRLQTHLYGLLCDQYGKQHVKTEHATGSGGYADALVRLADNRCFLYEIKVTLTAASAVREALGQLLEYAYRPGGFEPERLFIVAEPVLDEITEQFLARLNEEFRFRLEYFQIKLPNDD